MIEKDSIVVDTHSVFGLTDKKIDLWFEPNSICISVKLMPWALPVFINDAADSLRNKIAKVSEFRNLPNEFLDAFSCEPIDLDLLIETHIFPLLSSTFNSRTGPAHVLTHHVRELFRSVQNLTIEPSERKFGYSKRYLEKLYNEHVGMSPMKYKRLVKIKKASLVLSKDKDNNIHSLALALGYFDQSHFHKDFLKFTNGSPSQFALRSMESPVLNNTTYLNQYDYS
jgi:AraC-like DNA-binding protein